MSEMREALDAMARHRAASVHVNRTGWTREQWIEDAQRLMDDIDGSVTSLVNGHVQALLDAVNEHRAKETNYTCPSACVELNHPGREHAAWVADNRS